MSDIPDGAENEETSSGLPPKIAAAIACAFPLIGGLIMLALERRSRFVRFYAFQSIFFSLAWLVCAVAVRVATLFFNLLPVVGHLLSGVLSLAWLVIGLLFVVVWVFQIVKALSGVEWEIPYIGPFARKQMR